MPDDGARIVSIMDEAQKRGVRVPEQEWTDKLARREEGGWHPTLANALVILSNHRATAGMFGFNEFTSAALLLHAPPPHEEGIAPLPGPYPRAWGPADVALVQAWLQRQWDKRFSRETTEAAMLTVAETKRFHPVKEWLSGLKWDGKERLKTWLHVAFGAPTDAYHEAVGIKFLVAAVRRIKQPGCKFDSMLVLEGEQEAGKSRSCRALFGDEWFSDDLPHDLASRDAALSLLGVWGFELGELSGLIRNEVETVKAFLSRQVDRYRPPYGKSFVERPRQTVLMGTTNDDDYLRDSTGNRRFWPVRCLKAEHAWIAEVRDQLWAEAVRVEAEGEPLWLEEESVRDEARKVQKERLAEDLWAGAIRDHVYSGAGGPLDRVRAVNILTHAIGVLPEKQTRSFEMRVAAVLRADGWKPKVEWEQGKSVRWWLAPPPKESEG